MGSHGHGRQVLAYTRVGWVNDGTGDELRASTASSWGKSIKRKTTIIISYTLEFCLAAPNASDPLHTHCRCDFVRDAQSQTGKRTPTAYCMTAARPPPPAADGNFLQSDGRRERKKESGSKYT